LNILRN